MSSDVKIPEWAMEEARRIDLPTLSPLDREYARRDIAHALLAAEQRGEEKKDAEIEALLKSPVAVRGLEWDGEEAETILGTYKVKIDNNGDWRCFRDGWTLYASPKVPAIFGSEVMAKAAAQADFTKRILSCLTPASVSEEMVERLFQSIAPFIEGTAWREVRAAIITAALAGGRE